jgi:tetratricopeptide (TPR) repeat protein
MIRKKPLHVVFIGLAVLFWSFFVPGPGRASLFSPTKAPSLPSGQLELLARLETALLLRERGASHENAGRLEEAARNYEESLSLFPDPEVGKRAALLRKELNERTSPLFPPAPRSIEMTAGRLEKARELREKGKDAFVRGELDNSARLFEESLALFGAEDVALFVDSQKREMELRLSLNDLEKLFD